jgi:hypothetical protein
MMRIVRINPQLARVVAHSDAATLTDVASFDPTNPAGVVTRTTLPLDQPLEIARGDASIDVYGLRFGSGDGGTSAQLVLLSIADATGAVTELPLTSPGAIKPSNPASYQSEEPVMGRFLRFGPDDVYFTYTETVGAMNNPTYNLLVGRVTAATPAGVVPARVGSAAAHDFQAITASALTHIGSTVFLFTGASGTTTLNDGPRNSTQLALPDDGISGAKVVSNTWSRQVVAIGAGIADQRPIAFFAAPDGFSSSQSFIAVDVNDSDMSKLVVPQKGEALLRSSRYSVGVDSHFEQEQFLMFGHDRFFWYDAATRSARLPAAFPAALSSANVRGGSMTLASTPTASFGALDLAMDKAGGNGIVYVALACSP